MRVPREWRTPRIVTGLFGLEFCGTVAALGFFGIASPNLFRVALWKDGGLNKFNSDPNEILYAYANYQAIPKIPLVWSQFLTNFNLVVSVLSMFALLLKGVAHVMHLFYPPISLVLHLVLTAVWTVSVYGQAGPDYSDPRYPSSTPWYLTKSCSVAFDQRNVHYCNVAKGTFAVTVIMLSIFFCHILLAIFSMIPRRNQKSSRASSIDTVRMSKMPRDSVYGNSQLEAAPEFPPPPKTPFTPRTQAFNKLTSAFPSRSGKKSAVV